MKTPDTIYKDAAAKLRVEDFIADRSELLRADLEELNKDTLIELALKLYKDLRLAHRRMHHG